MEKEMKIAAGILLAGAAIYGGYILLKKKGVISEKKSEIGGKGDALIYPSFPSVKSAFRGGKGDALIYPVRRSDGHWCKHPNGGGYFSVKPCAEGDIEVFPKEVNFSGFDAQSMVTRYKKPNWTVG